MGRRTSGAGERWGWRYCCRKCWRCCCFSSCCNAWLPQLQQLPLLCQGRAPCRCKEKLGANAILAVSLALAKVGAHCHYWDPSWLLIRREKKS